MARLKTLNDVDSAAASDPVDEQAIDASVATGSEVATEQPASAPQNEPVAADTDTEGAGAQQAPTDEPFVAPSELEIAIARADRVDSEYLAQSDKLAAANATIARLNDDIKERDLALDKAMGDLAARDAQIAALGARPAPLEPTPAIKRPKVGKVLKLPEEDKFAPAREVMAALDAGEVLVMVLADDNGVVQPFPAVVGGKSMFTVRDSGLLYAAEIDLAPEIELVTVRHAVLLDADGKVLSACRFGALLIGGGGLSARIPGNNVRFNFD